MSSVKVQTPEDIAKKVLRQVRKGERLMDEIEKHPELVGEELDYRLERLAIRLKEFINAR